MESKETIVHFFLTCLCLSVHPFVSLKLNGDQATSTTRNKVRFVSLSVRCIYFSCILEWIDFWCHGVCCGLPQPKEVSLHNNFIRERDIKNGVRQIRICAYRHGICHKRSLRKMEQSKLRCFLVIVRLN